MFLGLGLLGTTAALSGVMGVTLTMAIGGADMPGTITCMLVTVVVTCYLLLSVEGSLVGVPIEKLTDQCEGDLSRKVTSSVNISFGSADPYLSLFTNSAGFGAYLDIFVGLCCHINSSKVLTYLLCVD